MIAGLPHSLWCIGSETREQLTVWHPSRGPLPASVQWVTDLERWVNEGGRGNDPDLRLIECTDASSSASSSGRPQ